MFTHNRDRLLEAEVARKFLAALLALPQVKKLLSSEHFSVDGTLIDAWASMKSFRPKDGAGEPPAPGRNGERNPPCYTTFRDTTPPRGVVEVLAIVQGSLSASEPAEPKLENQPFRGQERCLFCFSDTRSPQSMVPQPPEVSAKF